MTTMTGKSLRILGSAVFMIAALLPAAGIEGSEPLPIPPILEFESLRGGTKLFYLEADEGQREFIPGKSTRTLGYNGDYLGPTIRVRRGDDVIVRVKNSLRNPTTVHWHGADVPADSDGGPHQGIAPGETWDADFRVRQQAATLWYHPHFVETTGEQVYKGLAGLLIIDDENSGGLGLPMDYGVDDVPVILQERKFDRNGRFTYRPSMSDQMHGYFGNEILVNGAISPHKDVPRGPVRLRILNGSNSTLLRITFDGLSEFHQVASDGGFLERPVTLTYLVLSPGERAEVIADFSRTTGSSVVMKAETNGQQIYDAVEFRPAGIRQSAWEPPESLVTVEDIPESEASKTRRFAMQSGMGARMTINGKVMDMDRIDERLRLGDTEIWEIVNRDGMGGGMMGGMMNQPHSFHVHAVQFRILDINGRPPPAQLAGWKDTVLLWPGDRVRIIARYDSYKGLYMYHCHLLEHEDNGMMGQFLIE